ncbi:MAG: hypothetical protein IT204_26175 [Fimbriimonadaceae bacterium]|nr:hypothetical protein [Fimbriimonadaceae bacterium]
MNTLASLPPRAAPFTETALCRWLGHAMPGDTFTYFRGALARSACRFATTLAQDERVELCRLAARARKLADSGLAHLVQRRHGFEDYEYILVARRRPRPAVVNLLPKILAEAA